MDNLKIVVFLCNWGPHAAFQTLQDTCCAIPREVRMVRIPCSGRISKSLLFKAFEMGADGVALIGCETGTCRYGSGTDNTTHNVESTRGILEMLGIGEERLRWATFLPEDAAGLLHFLQTFQKDVHTLGKNPVVPPAHDLHVLAPSRPHALSVAEESARKLLAEHDIYACQDCGKCSSACPITLVGKPFSPRAMAGRIIANGMSDPAVDADIWSCLTCGLCHDRCPSAIDFPEFIRELRALESAGGSAGHEAHGGFFQSLMRTMTSPDLPIRHWDWLPEDVRTDPQSKILFFGGCAPYFDIFFRQHLDVQTSDILVDSLRLLNFFDITPAILPDERCCGHDLLWSGDRENFRKLARLNVDAIADLGVEEVVTACPECFRTLGHDYREQGVEPPFRVTHLYELLEREIDKGAIAFDPIEQRLTFQDPCRLSRVGKSPGGGAELPRKLLQRLQPKAYREMADSGVSGLCCGNCAWTGCDAYSKALQVKRLRQARETGSNLLVTACPKCQIHLRCAMEDPFRGEEIRMEMQDLTSVLARTIHWK
ncbi:MAG: methyl-viologen-reducing hydrogenase, delta subunit [Proteobacteria bacterium]|nr:methyl-viologen-reducing hydrogenase, delta subunit [Pseudomonadota bacterium]